jgi:hypothetical protein
MHVARSASRITRSSTCPALFRLMRMVYRFGLYHTGEESVKKPQGAAISVQLPSGSAFKQMKRKFPVDPRAVPVLLKRLS